MFGRSEPETPKSTWLERSLERAEKVDALPFNLWMLFGIVVLSALLSLVLWSVAVSWFEWTVPANSGLLVFLIAATVSFTVGAPSVFLGFALISRIHSISDKLRLALAAADLANRSKTEFLANMSHEVRTPLNGVLGMAKMLEASPMDDGQKEALRVIRESGDVLMAIISEVLDLSKIDVGQVTLDSAPQPLAPVLSSCVELFRAKAVENGNELSMIVDPGVPKAANYDSVRARQCLANLVSNAVKFTKNGEITITLSTRAMRDGWIVELSVKDTGIGIDQEDLPRLFQPFQQVGSRSSQVHGGTGLGLAISHRLAELMGGKLSVSSVPRQGSDFVLCFRAGFAEDQLPPPTNATSASSAADLAGVRALVVDDTPTNRIVVRSMLQSRGAKCLQAESGASALALVQNEQIDVILLDIRMPEKDGFEVFKEIKALGGIPASIPVIALTADVVSAKSDHYIALGFSGYLSKPLDIEELSSVVRTAVRTRMGACRGMGD